MQGMLENSLEALNHLNEQQWETNLETDANGMIHIGESFIRYKEKVNTLKGQVETHFSKTISQIEAGLPDVYDELTAAGEYSLSLDEIDTWTCPVCTTQN